MLRNQPLTDRYCRFNFNPMTGEYERVWIQYADGTFEPVRQAGSLKSKFENERTHFNWWCVRKPVEWQPWHDGCDFAWNHDFGEANKPEDWGDKSDCERVFGRTPYFIELQPDADGRIVSRTENIDGRREAWEFHYDEAGRLTGVASDTSWVAGYRYDAQGRRASDYDLGREPYERDFEYTADNRLLSAGATRYEHDAGGFRSAKTDADGTTLYAYEADYRLLGALLPDGTQITYEHDEDGQRSRKLVNGHPVEAYEWLDFIRLGRFHDGENEYVFHYGEGERLPRYMSLGEQMYTLGFDQVGSLKAVVSATGDVVKAIQYSPFGNILWDSNPDFRMPIGFAGGLHDPDTGFVRFGFRDYDPDTGRWTAQDPIGDLGGDDDWYGYCLDDPVNMYDPLGLWGYGGHQDHDGEKSSDPANSNDTAGRQSDSQAAENDRGGNRGLSGNETNSSNELNSYDDARTLNAKEKQLEKQKEKEDEVKSPHEHARDMEKKAKKKGLGVEDEKTETLGDPDDLNETSGNPGKPQNRASVEDDAEEDNKARDKARMNTYAQNLASYGKGKRRAKPNSSTPGDKGSLDAKTASIGSRPLKGLSPLQHTGAFEILGSLTPVGHTAIGRKALKALDKRLNTKFVHKGVVFDNGYAMGLSPDVKMDDHKNYDSYTEGKVKYDAGQMVNTIKNTPTGNYNAINNNCQDYTDRIKGRFDKTNSGKRH